MRLVPVMASAALVVALTQATAENIDVKVEGTTEFAEPITPVQVIVNLRFDFGTQARVAKVKVTIEQDEGPVPALRFTLPDSPERTVEIASFEADVSVEAKGDIPPGTYRGRLAFVVDSPEHQVVPSSVPFSFTIEQPDVQVSWAGASGGSLALGSVTRGDLAAFEGPTLTIKGKTGAEAPVTFQADHPHVGLRPTAGATVMGGGTVGAGTYKVVLAPETPAGTYQGTLRLSSMSNKVRLNGQVEPLAYTYDLTVTDPVTATLKLVGAGLGTLALVAGGFIAWRMVPRGKGGKKKGTRINLEGALELIRPAQRIEKLEKLERHKVSVGKGGDLFAEADARFELSAWMHDGQPTIVLRKHTPLTPISLNGRDISGDESEIYHGDVIRFGDTPRHEARYINPKIRGVHFLE